jgi:signal transduction histidine kinase
VILDITAEKERETALHAAKDAAEAASRAKADFLANISHELRTPLNAIIGFAELIQLEAQAGNAAGQQNGYAAEIIAGGRRLLEVVSNIIDMAKIDAGRYAVTAQAIALDEVVEACLAQHGAAAEQAGIALEFQSPPRLPAALADLHAVRQVLGNLLSNAVKFTPSGGRVAVTVSATPRDVTVTVADTGIGIAPEHLERLGEAFVQVDAGLTRRHEGAGLGLAISRRLAELQRGRLSIESRLGAGTTVRLSLPLGSPLAARAELQSAA